MTVSPNKILSALPPAEYEQLAPMLRPVALKLGETLYHPEEVIHHVYFVTEGVISLLATLESGATVEAGVIGPEGILGIPVILGVASTPNLALVQSNGSAIRGSGRAAQAPSRNHPAMFAAVPTAHPALIL